MADDNKLKHLELIQGVITRMANNSFYIKGWCITIAAALTALSQGDKQQYILVAILPVFLFWFLDAYYLRQEKLFREVYDVVRLKNEGQIDFSMKLTEEMEKKCPYSSTLFNWTVTPIYWAILITVGAIIYWINHSAAASCCHGG